MSSYWPLVVSGLCGFLLFAVVVALIFKPDFRKDLVAGQGKASLFGVLSIEGVIIVILCGMFLTGLLYPVWRSDNDVAHAGESAQEIDSLKKQLAASEETLRGLQSSNEKRFGLDDLPEVLAGLAPEDEISDKIRELSAGSKGPWSPFARSKNILVSVPGGHKEGTVYGCPDLHGKRLQIVSTYRPGEVTINGQSTLTVKVTGLMFAAQDCRKVVGYDLQLNCSDGVRLLSDSVLTCDADNNPLWNVKDRLFPASAVLILNGSG